MYKDITHYTQACLECQRNNAGNQKEQGFLHPLPVPSERFQDIAMDWSKISASATGQNRALIIVDRLTKLTVLISTFDNDTAEHTAELLIKHWICRGMGVPHTITSDRDAKFGASICKTIMNKLAIKHNIATARHQRTDCQAENMVKQVKTALTKLFDGGGTHLETLLPYLEFALNNSINPTTGFTPFYLVYGYHPQEFTDMELIEEADREYDLGDRMAQNISKAKEITLATQNQQCIQWDRHHREMHKYQVGDLVMLRSEGLLLAKFRKFPRHFVPRWLGPFPVLETQGAPNFKLKLPRTMSRVQPIFHGNVLKRYKAFDHSTFPGGNTPAKHDGNQDEVDGQRFEIESIIDKDVAKVNGKILTKYRVRWKGYRAEDDSWLEYSVLSNSGVKMRMNLY
jgi:hypothetical protein